MRHVYLRNDASADHYAVGLNSQPGTVLAQLQAQGEQVRVVLTPEQARDFARRLLLAADKAPQPAWKRYGIAVGQVYVPADGSSNRLTVRDVEAYADCDDVVVFDEVQGTERRIDAFKLAMVRYSLLSEQA